mgnify:CR=1 FL=1
MGEFKSGFFMSETACNGRVLVVDDEPDIRKVVRMTLQKAGYEVIEADSVASGERALLEVAVGFIVHGTPPRASGAGRPGRG